MAEIFTRKGERILVDDEDFAELSKYTWCVTNGYAIRKGSRTPGKQGLTIRMHRQILGVDRVRNQHVDHINGDTLDNRRCNLRLCSQAENMRNMRTHRDNAVGAKGVFKTKSGRFQAQICHDRCKVHLGTFDTAEDAHAAYRTAADKYHGEFANYGVRNGDARGVRKDGS